MSDRDAGRYGVLYQEPSASAANLMTPDETREAGGHVDGYSQLLDRPYQTRRQPVQVSNTPIERDRQQDVYSNFVQTDFEQVIAEQNGTESIDLCKPIHRGTYMFARNIWYKILSTLFGVFLAFMWGLFFASITFFINWMWLPAIQMTKLFMFMQMSWWHYCVRGFLDPWFESVGRVFSGIQVSLFAKPPTQITVSPLTNV